MNENAILVSWDNPEFPGQLESIHKQIRKLVINKLGITAPQHYFLHVR